MGASTIAAWVSAGAAVVGAVQQQSAAKKQAAASNRIAEEQRTQAKIEAQRAEVQNVRSVRQELRKQYIAAASVVGRGATTGTSASSGVAGGISSTKSQLAGNLSYMSDMADFGTAMTKSNMAIGDAQAAYGAASAQASMGAALQSLGGTVFSEAGGFDTLRKTF